MGTALEHSKNIYSSDKYVSQIHTTMLSFIREEVHVLHP